MPENTAIDQGRQRAVKFFAGGPESEMTPTDRMEDAPHPKQIEIWRKMSAAEKMDVFERLMQDVRALKAVGVRRDHPDWSEDEVDREVARFILHART